MRIPRRVRRRRDNSNKKCVLFYLDKNVDFDNVPFIMEYEEKPLIAIKYFYKDEHPELPMVGDKLHLSFINKFNGQLDIFAFFVIGREITMLDIDELGMPPGQGIMYTLLLAKEYNSEDENVINFSRRK
jgi:hypothetical protein